MIYFVSVPSGFVLFEHEKDLLYIFIKGGCGELM